MQVQLIPLSKVRIDGGTQPRARIDQDVVSEYAERLKTGTEFPPVDVFQDGAEYWLAEGFHRYHAAKQAGEKTINCTLHKGTQRDAILFSCGANQTHGLRRTNADKRKAVETLLDDEEWAKNSDRWIAEKCGVSHTFVADIRSEVATVATSTGQKRKGQDGKSYPASQPTVWEPGEESNEDVRKEDEEPVQKSPPEPIRPFAQITELPEDLAEAFESIKLAILRHKMAGWSEISCDDAVDAIQALIVMARSPSE